MNYFNETDQQVKKTYDKQGMDKENMKACPIYERAMCGCRPIYECPEERVVNRYICHEVPHILPCNTRIVNHHVYCHTYRPEYTCCEENVCENVYEPRCCM